MIETQGLGKIYGRGLYALRDLNLTIDKGEFVFLTGPSGAGKSTLLRLLLLQERPSEGEVIVGGRNLALSVSVPARETIMVDGAPVSALRVEPRFTARVQRRQAIESTLWLSDDARRVPLVVEVAAGFGRLRLKLVDYRP